MRQLTLEENRNQTFQSPGAFPTFCMMIFLFKAFSLYRKHDHTGRIVFLVSVAACVGLSLYVSLPKSNRRREPSVGTLQNLQERPQD
jgi:hypothetical protein